MFPDFGGGWDFAKSVREGASPMERWKWNETIGPVQNRPGRQGMSFTNLLGINTNRNKVAGAIQTQMLLVKRLAHFPTR